jgi:hypothetical protein
MFRTIPGVQCANVKRRIVACLITLGMLTACSGGPVTCEPPDPGDGCEVTSGPVIEDGKCFYEIGCS